MSASMVQEKCPRDRLAAISTVTIKTKTQRMTNSEPVKGRLRAGRYRGKRTVGFEENGEPNWIHRKRDCDREEGI